MYLHFAKYKTSRKENVYDTDSWGCIAIVLANCSHSCVKLSTYLFTGENTFLK